MPKTKEYSVDTLRPFDEKEIIGMLSAGTGASLHQKADAMGEKMFFVLVPVKSEVLQGVDIPKDRIENGRVKIHIDKGQANRLQRFMKLRIDANSPGI